MNNMFYVYVIYSQIKNVLYKGLTSNLERRLREHNEGYNQSTKPGSPWKLIYREKFKTRKEARQKEKYFKSGIGREFLRKMVKFID